MNKQAFNDGWCFSRLGVEEMRSPITLPHDAMISEPRTADAAGGTNTGFFEGYDYEYTKEFDAPKDAAYIEFEGVYHRAEVFVDGMAHPAHPNGYFGFKIPVTEGKHTIRVIAHNAEQPNSRWYSGAGIYRPVHLVCLPEKHILPESIAIKTLDYKARKISVAFETTHGGEVSVEVCGATASGERSVVLALPGAELWSPECPNLYTARLTYGEALAIIERLVM